MSSAPEHWRGISAYLQLEFILLKFWNLQPKQTGKIAIFLHEACRKFCFSISTATSFSTFSFPHGSGLSTAGLYYGLNCYIVLSFSCMLFSCKQRQEMPGLHVHFRLKFLELHNSNREFQSVRFFCSRKHHITCNGPAALGHLQLQRCPPYEKSRKSIKAPPPIIQLLDSKWVSGSCDLPVVEAQTLWWKAAAERGPKGTVIPISFHSLGSCFLSPALRRTRLLSVCSGSVLMKQHGNLPPTDSTGYGPCSGDKSGRGSGPVTPGHSEETKRLCRGHQQHISAQYLGTICILVSEILQHFLHVGPCSSVLSSSEAMLTNHVGSRITSG